MKDKGYPFKKVTFLFALAPALAGLVMALIGIVEVVSSKGINHSSLFSITFIPLFVIYSLVFFGIPSVILGVFYAYLKLSKGWWGYIFVFFIGGAGASLWSGVVTNEIKYNLSSFSADSIMYFFTLGAVSSLIVAFFALPKK
jgi:hypothetical protein